MSTDTHFLRLWRWFTPHRLLNPASGPWIGLLRRLFPSQEARHPFDRAHRIDTGGLIYADGLSTGHEHDMHSSGYYATAPSLFRGAMEHWSATLEASPFRLTDYAFIDIGCGKGRVVLLASEYAFREVVGVELNPQLASVARRNLQSVDEAEARLPQRPHCSTGRSLLHAAGWPGGPLLLQLV